MRRSLPSPCLLGADFSIATKPIRPRRWRGAAIIHQPSRNFPGCGSNRTCIGQLYRDQIAWLRQFV
jgi:hypothetical protein